MRWVEVIILAIILINLDCSVNKLKKTVSILQATEYVSKKEFEALREEVKKLTER